MKRFILILFICFVQFNAFSMSKDDYIDDATTIISLFETQYAPLKWKEENLGLNFSEMSAKLLNDAASCKSDKEFYEIVAKFLASFEDAHMSYQIPSTYLSRLPFSVSYVQGEALISFIDDEEVEKEQFPFKRGDILVAIDGVKVQEIADEIIKYIDVGHEAFNNSSGYELLTHRPQRKFPYIPTGKAKVTIQPREGGSSKTVELEWITTGFDIPEKPSAILNMMKMVEVKKNDDGVPKYDKFDDVPHAANNSNRQIKPFFELWEGFVTRVEEPFLSGTFEIDGKKVGYLRIDTWDDEKLPDLDKITEFIDSEVSYFRDDTDVLVIDQTGNTGGNACYVATLGSYFTGIPRDETKHALRANRSWLVVKEKSASRYDGLNNNLVELWAETVRDSIVNGKFLTPPLPMCWYTSKIRPNKDKNGNSNNYHKPIFILNDIMSVSASEDFSSLLQDWGVGVVFGTRTVGGGGAILELANIGHSELEIVITRSLMYREKEVVSPEGNRTHYIEDVGVTPDIPYEITIDDFLNGYKGYREAVNKAVLSLIQK